MDSGEDDIDGTSEGKVLGNKENNEVAGAGYVDGKSVGSYDGDTLPSILGAFVGLCIGVGTGIVEDMFENALPDGRNVGTGLVKLM